MANDVELRIKVNTKEAEAALRGFAGSVQGFIGGVKKIAGVVAGALAIRELARGVGDVVRAAADQEQAITRLNASLKLAGSYSSQASARFQALASELQHNSKFDDEVIMQNIALAKSFDVTNRQAEKMVRAAVDLSAATGMDLNAATQALGRTMDGTAGKIGEVIPQIQGLSRAQLQAGAAIDVVAARFGGASAASMDTFSGTITRIGHAFEDVIERIGSFITQSPPINLALKKLVEIFQYVEGALSRNSDAIQRFVNEGIAAVIGAIPAFIGGLQAVISVIYGVAKALGIVITGYIAFLNWLYSFKTIQIYIEGVAKAVAFLAAGFVELLRIISKVPGVSKLFKELGINTEDVEGNLAKMRDSLFDVTQNFSVEKVRNGLDKAGVAIAGAFIKGDKAVEGIQKSLSGVKEKAKKFSSEVDEVTKSHVRLSNDGSRALKNLERNYRIIGEDLRRQIINQIAQNPIDALLRKTYDKRATTLEIGFGVASGFAQQIAKGMEGAVEMISSGLGAVADYFVPGIGSAVKEIVKLLTQAPALVSQQIWEFMDAIPIIMQNVLENLFNVTDTLDQAMADMAVNVMNMLAEKLPDIIAKLTAQAPFIGLKVSQEITKNIPHMIGVFARELVKTPKMFVEELIRQIKGLFGNQMNTIGNVFSSDSTTSTLLTGGLNQIFAKGGMVPEGYPNDTFRAGLSSGELVIDRSNTSRLNAFLDMFQKSMRPVQPQKEVSPASTRSGPVVVQVVMNQRVLAETILDLNGKGFRLA